MAATTSTPSSLYFFIDCHIRETRMNLYKRFREPKLFREARRLHYDNIVRRCKRHPKIASREAKFRHDYVNQQCALHFILEPLYFHGIEWDDEELKESLKQARHEAAKALLEVFPDCALLTCIFGTSPLMMVCIDSEPCIQNVNVLLKARPECASMVDIEQRTALHYACVNNRNNLPLIQKLTQICPAAASMVDKNGRTPLHYACMAGPSINSGGNMQKQQQEHPEFANYVVFKNVLKEQSKAKVCHVDVVSLLLETNPDAAVVTDEDGRTPLHYLCLYGKETLLLPPDEVDMNNNDATLQTAEMQWARVLDIVTRKCPDAAIATDDCGLTPLEMFNEMGRRRSNSGSNCSRYVMEDLLDFLQQKSV